MNTTNTKDTCIPADAIADAQVVALVEARATAGHREGIQPLSLPDGAGGSTAGWERRTLLGNALAAATQAIRDEDYHPTVPAALAPHLPVDLLGEALDAARSILDEEDRAAALAALAPRLADLPLPDLSTVWVRTLPVLAARTRSELNADIRSLVPVLNALAGQNASIELYEISRAITEVARWWP